MLLLLCKMPAPVADTVVIGALDPVDSTTSSSPSHQTINEEVEKISKDDGLVRDTEINAAPPFHDDGGDGRKEAIIVTGADAANYLLPLRDDGEPALTFRSLFLATVLSCFQAVMTQIYQVS